MRLGNFESMGLEPLGEGDERRTFVNPEDESKIISEMKEDAEKDTPRQLKGRYYLTKIAHLLLPKNIPDIYQAGESRDGTQTIDAERISHMPGHKLLQEMRQSGEDEGLARKQIIDEMGKEMGELTMELSEIGLGFNIDEYVGNYTKDETGNVYYLETFKPWVFNPKNPEDFEVLFDEETMKEAIEGISDQETKEKCMKYFKRLLVLLEEEKQELQENNEASKNEASKIECGPHIEEIEAWFAPNMSEDFLATLNNIKTEKDAEDSEERKNARKTVSSIFEKLKFLRNEANITSEEYDRLNKKLKTLSNAVGTINRGVVDHDR